MFTDATFDSADVLCLSHASILRSLAQPRKNPETLKSVLERLYYCATVTYFEPPGIMLTYT